MKTIINYTTPKNQIQKLISQNLIINDVADAEKRLTIYGYSNLIKSYRDPFVITEDGKKKYRDGVSFEQIASLYMLDKNLRNAVMSSMLDLEEHLKESAASVIAKSFGTDQNEYLKFKNYRDKKRAKEQFRLNSIINRLKLSLSSDKDPIKHYRDKYKNVPPWILFKSIYFTTIINFIALFKPNEHEKMATRLYNHKKLGLTIDSTRKLMMDTLYICGDYRNRAAHGGRIYNYISKCQLRASIIFNDDLDNISGVGQLLFLLNLLEYNAPYIHLKHVLDHEVTRHCSMFPQDATYLGQILNVNIVEKQIVYINDASKKFHYDSKCSGIKNVKMVEYEDAVKRGYCACKRCIKI